MSDHLMMRLRRSELIRIGHYWHRVGRFDLVGRCLRAWLWHRPPGIKRGPIEALIDVARSMGADLTSAEAQEIDDLSKCSNGVRKAEQLGEYLCLPDAVRAQLKIRTIGAHDVSKRQRTLRMKAKRREREAARRKARGATPRPQSLSQRKPWKLEGMSRAAWYRNQKHRSQDNDRVIKFRSQTHRQPQAAKDAAKKGQAA